MYCATTVYVYLAKQDPTAGLTSIDIANLEAIINAMEAIARTHNVTRAFLQQAFLDIEGNGLSSSVQLPMLRKYRNAFGEARSNIPLLARSSVAKHTAAAPILSGNQALKCSDRRYTLETEADMGNAVGRDCFQAVLGAVSRNVAPPQRLEVATNKRKRMSPSPGPDLMAGLGRPQTSSVDASTLEDTMAMPTGSGVPIFPLSAQMGTGNIGLPDRTSSSSSSPCNQGSFSKTTTGSSHTSPGLGLGSTAEENRIDLRAFQDRMTTPIWPNADETFFTQINETMINILPAQSGDAWGILDADLSWDHTSSLF